MRVTTLADRFRDPSDPFRIVIVRDMWLTGFDAPSLHTIYVDKPMRGHALMQAIARVNRVFRDKPGGLVVDYLGLADELRNALKDYTAGGGKGKTAIDQAKAVAVMLEKYEIVAALFHGFDYACFFTGTPTERVRVLPAALEHVLAQEDGRMRLSDGVAQLSKAFALAVPQEDALRIRDDVAFFQAVKAALPKPERAPGKGAEELEHAVRQIVAGAIVSEGVIDVFAAAGLPKPDISILSDEFLAEVRGLPQKNLAVELLRKLLADEVRTRARRNLVQARAFSEMLERSIHAYQNRAIETAAVIEELIDIARRMREAKERGEKLGLSEDELAFYDALGTNDSAVAVLGDETLRQIAQELAVTVRNNTTIDWAQKESVRARLRLLVKKLLKKHGYPPDRRAEAPPCAPLHLQLTDMGVRAVRAAQTRRDEEPEGREDDVARDTKRVPIDAAGEHYVLYMLYRLGIDAALLPPRTPIGDIVLIDPDGGIGAWIQVKTSGSGSGWRMTEKNETIPYRGEQLWYALVDLAVPPPNAPTVYIVPSEKVAEALKQDHERFLRRGGKDTPVRKLRSPFPYDLPDFKGDWLSEYREAWKALPGQAATADS